MTHIDLYVVHGPGARGGEQRALTQTGTIRAATPHAANRHR
jgi:hypothetical protein